MRAVVIIGCGFVADLYMRSLETFPDIQVLGAFDKDADRLAKFTEFWKVSGFASLDAAFDALPSDGIVLNLTNPSAHYEINAVALRAERNVYSEKPLATDLSQARDLCALAQEKGLMLASAPCSVLGEAAQLLMRAVRDGTAGTPRLIYAELDDGYIPQAPYKDWNSESGAPWPYRDEFHVGCTLEHAGYYLTWLIGMFGRVQTVVAASAETIPDKEGGPYGTPDFSVATLFFENGPVARLTCSITASHDHQIRVIGDKGVLSVNKAWANAAPVKFFKRMRIRRRLLEHPLGRRIRAKGPTHPKVGRRGAASMNFALGVAEMFDAQSENRPCRLSPEFALHLTEVTLAIQNAGQHSGAIKIASGCDQMELMPWAR